MASPSMIKDSTGISIPALRVGTIVNDDVDGTTDSSALPTGATIIEIASNTDCWLAFGGSTITVSNSNGFFFPKGAAVYAVDEDQTYIAYIQDAETGRISITELY